jgi:hypothetical protein
MLFTVNVGPPGCLQAGGDESELIGSECGFEASHICSEWGLKSNVVCEPE